MRRCGFCGGPNNLARADAIYCSPKCRVYGNRAKPDPLARLKALPRWVRRTANKIPITANGASASSTDPSTWTTYAKAKASTKGAGLGFVLGDGIACIDLDHCIVDGRIDPRAVELIVSAQPFYVEVSPSGEGLHAWVSQGSPTGRNKYTLDNGLKVEWYERERYITITGDKIDLAVTAEAALNHE